MAKYKRKQGIVEAVQWYQQMGHPLVKRTEMFPGENQADLHPYYHINTVSGQANVQEGDWIVTRSAGDSYPVNSKVFEALYEKVEE